MNEPVYLDYNATTPHAPEVEEAVAEAMRSGWGNPSTGHPLGVAARELLDTGRADVAGLLGCSPDEVVFTSGGTESNNTAIIGCAPLLEGRGRHMVTSRVEHPAVEEPLREMEQRGWEVTRIGVGMGGAVDPENFVNAFREDTVFVSLMHAHNETGVIQPVMEIAKEARERGILVHSDAAQTVGKLNVDVGELGVDLLSVAGHKLYGPRGIGALYVRAGTKFGKLLFGAGHEGGRRAGTENVPGIAGLGVACRLAKEGMFPRLTHLARMRATLERELKSAFPGIVIHGEKSPRLPNTTFCSIPGVDGRALISAVQDRLAISAGSACHEDGDAPAGVLKEMGVLAGLAVGTLRISVGSPTTEADISAAVGILKAEVQ